MRIKRCIASIVLLALVGGTAHAADKVKAPACCVELATTGETRQGSVVELVCLAQTKRSEDQRPYVVFVTKVSGSGSERKEDTLEFQIQPGQRLPIGFGTAASSVTGDLSVFRIQGVVGPIR
jgi:hypothetical protein